jgi:hypothetical protein
MWSGACTAAARYDAAVRAFAIVTLAMACGRVNFDLLGDCAFSIEPAVAEVNLNTRAQVTADGAGGALTWRVARGQGSIDASGLFTAGDRVETVTIEATDASGCTASANIDVRGSTLFYVAGVDANSLPVTSVFASADGVAWQMIGALPNARSRGKLVVFEDRMWWLSGSMTVEVWSSSDGVSWRAESPAPQGLSEFGAAAYRGRMWIVGGANTGNVDTVYSTADGVTWQLTGHLPVAMHGTKCLGYHDTLWCVGGHDTARFTRVFSTSDGVAWIDEAPLPFQREEQGTLAMADDLLMVIAGSDNSGGGATSNGAFSRDGVTWTIATTQLTKPLYIVDLAQLGNVVYAAGADTAVRATTDGDTWTQVGSLPAYRAEGGFVAFTPH